MNFVRKYYKRILFLLTVLILIILIGLSSVGRGEVDLGFFGNAVAGFQKLTFNTGHTIISSIYSVQDIVRMREENNMLTDTVHELQETVRILENIVNKSEALETEYEMKKNLKYDYTVGQVIALDDSNWFSRVTIDKGEKDGIKKNDIVIHAVETEVGVVQIGLVGVVTQTSSNWAKVITLLDESCKISFRDINTDESGILQGSVDGTITGYFFNSKAQVNKDDSLVTSGIGEIYIPDIYIGKVTEIVPTTDASTQRIVINPAVEFTKLNRVYVLKVDR
ncbi:rod shape-determining protein MreC [Sedimentibacter hydroxybenzoicus DSM 7310]|uniref:Cell shape-determining protein MreC n=1 Tax=Sedimentibacter hydroxybenzoicus DSM 7310 TaxID=1123245 RepID=A0A974BJ59_SEDHY|nr:rod shape-determining protein MreC [Sedimentibacter hydroxybenzoicus]NYB74053.1 rod shape-determining protein MreC [Sedimentibacter hydroxybenzoicus DSM 7310]